MTQFFREKLEELGHEVQIIGPRDPETMPGELPENTVLCPSLRFPHYKGYQVPIPIDPDMFTRPWDLDIVHAQSNSLFLHFAVWLREYYGIPLLPTNTIHMPSYTQHVLSEDVLGTPGLRDIIDWRMGGVERDFASNILNRGDGLIVLCRDLVSYWRERGVTTPIHVIPRPVRPELFDKTPKSDPFPAHFAQGGRIIVVCRHAREKCLDRLIRIFAAYVEPLCEGASLTLVGDGPAHGDLQALAKRLGVSERVHFAGAVPQAQLVDYYKGADVFAYTSLSETFGCVVSEAAWCGLPMVAFDDCMGVAHQVRDERNGRLIPTRGFSDGDADIAFGRSLTDILSHRAKRNSWGDAAARIAHREYAPERIMGLTLAAYEAAAEHRRETLPKPAIECGSLARGATTWRHVHSWAYQNAAFWMLGQFLRSRSERVPDVLGEAVKMSPPAPVKTLPAALGRKSLYMVS